MSEMPDERDDGRGYWSPPAHDAPSLLSGTRILLGDRDDRAASAAAGVLRAHGAAQVVTVGSAEEFLRAALRPPAGVPDWDAAVWDTGLSGQDDALTAFLEGWHARHPAVPVVVAEDAPSTRRAVAALRGHAADMVERGDPAVLVAAVVRVLHSRPAAVPQEQVSMLVVGAHPDDVEIGAGGTIRRRADEGWDVTILTLSQGAGGGDPERRRAEAHSAAEVMGARLVMEDLPDGSMTDNSSTVRTIERTVAETRPDVVLVHSDSDTHQDHRAVHRATLVACRQVQRLACYQSPSATVSYQPNRFIGLRESHVAAKLSAIRAHRSQAASRWYLEEDLLRSTVRYWGRFSRARFAEPLEVIRDAAPLGHFPADHV
ncbi:PIG-L deacetylase family protein [Streptomyces sp. NPDC055189]